RQDELQFALLQLLFGALVSNRRPEATIPKHHRSAAVLTLRNGAFEISVIERMILDLHRQSLVFRIDRRAARYRPRFEHAVEFEPESVMQPRVIMFLDDKSQMLRWANDSRSAWLGGFREVTFGTILGEFFLHHLTASAQSRSRTAI